MAIDRSEAIILMTLLVACGCLLGFVWLAGEMLEGDTEAFDKTVLAALRTPGDPGNPVGPLWLEETARDITSLGSMAVLSLLTLSTLGYLLILRQWGHAILVTVSIGGGMLVSLVLKLGFDRSRPDFFAEGVHVFTSSFPSQHAMLTAVAYLTLGVLLARIQPNLRLKIYLMSLALFLTLLVGSSRLYLGVHWPSDVIAGWGVGAAWALLCWLVSIWLEGSLWSARRAAAPPEVRRNGEEGLMPGRTDR